MNAYIGTHFDDFLAAEGIIRRCHDDGYEACHCLAIG
jgi:hypothetical protein